MYEFSERVLFSPLAPARRGDFGARFDNGIYLGCRARRTLERPQESSDAGRCDSSVLRRDGTQNSC